MGGWLRLPLLWRQSRQTVPTMRIVNTRAKYMYVPVVIWYISKSVFLHSAAIHLVGIAGKKKKIFLLKRTNSRLGLYMYFATVFTLRITDKVCLDWRRGQRPLGLGSTLKFVNNISTDKNCLFTFHSSKHISDKSFILKKYHRWL